jgi:multidrug resistance efflux pump
MRARNVVLSALVMGFLGLSLAQAQDAQPPARGQRGARMDPAQMREQFMTRIKEQLGASDEEWKALQPKVEQLMTLSRDARAGGGAGMMMGRRGVAGGGPGGATAAGDTTAPQSDVAKAQQALQATLDNQQATADEIKAKLTALREAREKAKQELAKAQEAVRQLVTQRQEARLVMMGLLD